MSTYDFRLPDLGEGLTEATVIRWLVEVGQSVEIDSPLAEVETAKTTVELPSPYAGVVGQIHVDESATVPVGSVLVTLQLDSQAAGSTIGQPFEELPGEVKEKEGATPLLVGYGTSRKPSISLQPQEPVRAKPPVRRLARDLGVDLSTIRATGVHGEVTRDDVMRLARKPSDGQGVPLTGIRKQMAQAMSRSAAESPQATLFLTVDVTHLMSLRSHLNKRFEGTGIYLSDFGLICYLFTQAIHSSPLANAHFDDESGTLVTRSQVSLGIAVAGPNGLVVPNIKAADTLSIADFAAELTSLIKAARTDTLRTDQLLGGTITVTNIGALGIDSGVPLLNPGESVILAVGSIKRRPWVITDPQEHLAIRSTVELALTIDHRIMDGKDGADLLSATADLLAQPALLLMGEN